MSTAENKTQKCKSEVYEEKSTIEGKGVNEMERRGDASVLPLNPAACVRPTPHLHIKLALWLPTLSEGQLSLFLLA